MTSHGRTLSIESIDADVRVLHRELAMLGHAIAGDERRRRASASRRAKRS